MRTRYYWQERSLDGGRTAADAGQHPRVISLTGLEFNRELLQIVLPSPVTEVTDLVNKLTKSNARAPR